MSVHLENLTNKMVDDNTVRIKTDLDISKLPADVAAAKTHINSLGTAASQTYAQMNQAAKAANDKARQYSEQYTAFWLKQLDKQDAAQRAAYNKGLSELNAFNERKTKENARAAKSQQAEVDAINAQTRANAAREAKSREAIATRLANHEIAEHNRVRKDAVNNFTQGNQPTQQGGGVTGGALTGLLNFRNAAGGGLGGAIRLAGGGGGAGGGAGGIGALAGAGAAILPIIAGLYALIKVVDLAKQAMTFLFQLTAKGAAAWFEYSSHIEQVAIGFKTLLGSAEAAQVHMKELAKLAESTPFQFKELADASRRLLAMGVAASDVKRQLIAIGNAVSAVGGGAVQFDRVVYALGDIQAKGKLTGEEVRQLANNAIPVMRILTEELNISSKAVRKLIEDGQISAEIFTEAFESFVSRKFGDAMAAQSETFIGALSNIEDALLLKSQVAFKPLFDAISQIATRFAAAMTGAGGIIELLTNTSTEFSRTGGEMGESFVNGLVLFLRNPNTQKSLITAYLELVDAINPAKIAAVAVKSAGEAAISRYIAGKQGLTYGTGREGDDLKDYFDKRPSDKIDSYYKPLPAGSRPKEGETSEDFFDRVGQLQIEKYLADLTGKDGAQALKDYKEQIDKLGISIKYFGQDSNEARVRMQLFTQGFKDFNSAEAVAAIALGKKLDALEAAEKKQKALTNATDAYKDKIKDVSRDTEASLIGLTLNTETGANNLAIFNAKVAKEIEELGVKAGQSAEKIAADLDVIREAKARLDDAEELATVGSEILKVDAAVASLKYKLAETTPEMEKFYEFLASTGLAAKYGAEGQEELTKRLDEFLVKLREQLKLEKQLTQQRRNESLIRRGSDKLEDITKALNVQLEDSRRGGKRKTALDEFYESVKNLDGLNINTAPIKELQVELEKLGDFSKMDSFTQGVNRDAFISKLQQSLAGITNADDRKTFATNLLSGLQAAIKATEELTPVQAERNRLDIEFRDLQEAVGIAAETQAERYRNAWEAALNDVEMRDIEATESMIKSQVEIANSQVFSSTQARAKIYEHIASAKGYTDIVSDAFISATDSIGDAMSGLFSKVNSGLGKFGEILTDIQTSLIKMVTNRLLMKLVDALLGGESAGGGGGIQIGNTGGGQRSGGGGGFAGIGGLIGGIARGGGGQSAFNPNTLGAAGNNGGGSIFGAGGILGAAGYSGSNISDAQTFTGQSNLGIGRPRRVGDVVGANGNSPFSSGQGGGILGSLAGALPLLGLSFGASAGASLGRGSRVGSVLGAAGLGGLGFATASVLPAILAGSFAGLTALGAATFGVGAALAVAALIIGRNARRRADERTRNQLTLDANSQLDTLIRQVRNHQTDPASALSQASEIRANYLTQAGQLKDRKARNHALLTVRELDYRITQLRSAATVALNDNSRRNITSAFATGGVVSGQRGQPRLILAHGGEIIASLANQTPALVQAAAEAGIPAVRGNGDTSSSRRHTNLNVELRLGTDAQNKLFVNGAKSDDGYNVIVKQSKTARSNRDI